MSVPPPGAIAPTRRQQVLDRLACRLGDAPGDRPTGRHWADFAGVADPARHIASWCTTAQQSDQMAVVGQRVPPVRTREEHVMKKRVLACAVLGAALGFVGTAGPALAATIDAEGRHRQGVGDAEHQGTTTTKHPGKVMFTGAIGDYGLAQRDRHRQAVQQEELLQAAQAQARHDHSSTSAPSAMPTMPPHKADSEHNKLLDLGGGHRPGADLQGHRRLRGHHRVGRHSAPQYASSCRRPRAASAQ